MGDRHGAAGQTTVPGSKTLGDGRGSAERTHLPCNRCNKCEIAFAIPQVPTTALATPDGESDDDDEPLILVDVHPVRQGVLRTSHGPLWVFKCDRRPE